MRSETISVEGRRHEVLRDERGPAGAPTLVFLHEGLGSAKLWRDFPERLAAALDRPAFVYSRLGYGGSDPTPLPRPLSYMEDEARSVLPRLLDAAGIERAILVGHSDGASIALVHAALDGGHRVQALVLEAPHVFVEELSVASIAQAREAYEQGGLRARLQRWHGANVEVAFRGWNDAWLDPRFRTAFQLEGFLPEVRVPTLAVQGEDDEYGTLAQLDAIARGVRGPFERAILPRCGHAPHKDQPELTLAAMTRFLAAHLARG